MLAIEDGVTTVAISPSGEHVAAGSLDKSVRVWDITNGSVVGRLDGVEGHKDSVYSVAFSPDGEHLVSGSLDKTIKMWQLHVDSRGGVSRGGRCIKTFEGHKVSSGVSKTEMCETLTTIIGLCAQCCFDTRCRVGSQWFKR